jgi:hypothetical protein
MSKDHKLGDAPIEPQHRSMMNTVAHVLDEAFNGDAKGKDRKVGFCLLVFNFGDEGRCNYISNAERIDMITLLKEQLKRFEGWPEISGTA